MIMIMSYILNDNDHDLYIKMIMIMSYILNDNDHVLYIK